MTFTWRWALCVIAAMSVVGCHRGSDEDAAPPTSQPTYTLQGVVFDAYSGALANLWVYARVGFGDSYSQSVATDGSGRFSFTAVPRAKVFLWAPNRGYVQPCALTVDVHGDVVQDIEVVSADTLNSLAPPRPLSVREPVVTGTVYEMTAMGRQPIAGAIVGVSEEGWGRASTLTDLSGRYFVCNLPSVNVGIGAGKAGYLDTDINSFDTSQSTLDIELVKEGG